MSITYEYDGFGRLRYTRDEQRRILQRHDYKLTPATSLN